MNAIRSQFIDPVVEQATKPMGVEEKPYLDKFRHLIKKHVHFDNNEIFELYNALDEKVIMQKAQYIEINFNKIDRKNEFISSLQKENILFEQ